MSNIIQLFADKLKTIKGYPITLEKLVFSDNGQSLDNTLGSIKSDINNLDLDDIKTYDNLVANLNEFMHQLSIGFCNTSTLNRPDGTLYGVCLGYGSKGVGWHSQLFTDTNTGNVFSRIYSNGNWTEWHLLG